MRLWERVLRFLVNDRWEGCHVPTPGKRKAAYERRLGEHKAAEALRKERLGQAFDLMASQRLTTPKTIRLPQDKKPAELRVVK